MKQLKPITITLYTTDTGKQPFADWQKKLDTKTEAVILTRIGRVRGGNFGDCKPIKGSSGIYELVIDYGPGYRIYYAKQGATIVFLLTGGKKKSQESDIEKAKRYWLDHKERT